jgi:hypothetical protein
MVNPLQNPNSGWDSKYHALIDVQIDYFDTRVSVAKGVQDL